MNPHLKRHQLTARATIILIGSFLVMPSLSPDASAFSMEDLKKKVGMQTESKYIDEGDNDFWKMDYKSADSLYTIALKQNPDTDDVYWKLARLRVSMGDALPTTDKEGKEKVYTEAKNFAEEAVKIDNNNSMAHAWLAASIGMLDDDKSSKEQLKSAHEIKQELDTALQLNPNNATALSLLGTYYKEVASIGGLSRFMGGLFVGKIPEGTYAEAESAFRKAISLDPTIVRNYHELALVLIEEGKKKEAIAYLETGITKQPLFYSDKIRIEQMKKLLEKMTK